MVDLISLISNILNQRQRAEESAQQNQQFGRELAFKSSESAADRAARLAEQERNLGFEREQLGARTSESAADRAARFTEQDRALGFSREQLAQSGNQFGQTFNQGSKQFAQSLAQRQAEESARNSLNRQELLGNLATQTGSYDILDLLGRELGVPNLGALRRLQGGQTPNVRGRSNPSGGTGSWRGGTTWDAISGWIPQPGPAWENYMLNNPANSGSLAAQPTAPGPSRLPKRF
jgi:hypothetical protein